MIEARLRTRIPADELEAKVGKVLGEADFNAILTGPAKLLKPNGHPLVVYLPGALLDQANDPDIYATFHSLKGMRTGNRGAASGSRRVKSGTGNKSRALPVPSSIIGAFDSAGHQKYCRLTAWTGANLPQWETLRPFLLGIARHFEDHLPDRYGIQMEQARATYPEWVVPGTPFTTVTVNNCVDEETTCLTREHGWTRYDQLRTGDHILAYDPATHTTQWQPILDVFVNEHYGGDMIELSSRGFSALTTPDHRWPLQRPAARGGLHAVMTSNELPTSHYWAIMRSAPHVGATEPTYSDAFVRLVAWYITEGTLTRAGTSVSLCQSDRANPIHVDAIRRDLKEIGAISLEEWRNRPCTAEPGCTDPVSSNGMCNKHACAARYRARKNGTGRSRRQGLVVNEYRHNGNPEIVVWVLTGTDVEKLIAAAPGEGKVPTMEFLSTLTPEQAALFVETCIAADGSPEWSRFCQHHKGRMGAFVVAAVLAGLPPVLDSTGTHCYLRRDRSALRPGSRIALRSVKRETVHYEGTIWCPRVPSGHWVAQRNGTVYLTGNTYPTGVHLDAGDLEAGFSTLACIRKGSYTGGQLVFPKYRVALDMHHGDLALIDAHEYHGNTVIVCVCGERRNGLCDTCGAERISVVAYFRENMTRCGTYLEELAKAMNRAEARNRKRRAAEIDDAATPAEEPA